MKKQIILEIGGISYSVESQLGQGGMAKVLKVRSSLDDEFYALKQIEKVAQQKRNERVRNEIGFGLAARSNHVVRT